MKKLEDDNLEVYLIEAQEVKDWSETNKDEIDEAYNKDIGLSSDEEYQYDSNEEEKEGEEGQGRFMKVFTTHFTQKDLVINDI
mmetsp:Transcript_15329/g.14915  ORF Transcript_15329/g.14915 Transcript_15329/m.14915 type:complete len:83 (+) Transcript_15329:1-249(+)